MKKQTIDVKNKLLKRVYMLALTMCLIAGGMFLFPVVSRAESQGKITASSAKIRQEASVNSTMIDGASQGETLTVISQVKAADGYTWYKVKKGEKTGYIRGDLMTITDGSTPPTEGEEQEVPAAVTAVNPVSATVAKESGRIRANASTTSNILTNVSNGAVLTVTGTAIGTDGAEWYQVSYNADGTQVDGFVRSDYVTLSGELTPWTEPPAVDNPPQNDPAPEQPVIPDTPYQMRLDDNGEWCIYPVETPEQIYEIKKLYEIVNDINDGKWVDAQYYKTAQRQKIVIILLVFLLAAAVAGIAFLIFKIRDMMDSAYFSEVENETLRKRSSAAAKQGGRAMQTVGNDKSQGRPSGTGQGARPAGASQSQQRPVGAGQQRMSGTGQRPSGAGQRPSGTSQNQQRLAGAGQVQKPSGAGQGGPRPSGAPQGQRPAGTSQIQRPQGARPDPGAQARPPKPQPKGGPRQSRNFMADEDDDEFEFEYLNYNGDDEQ